MIYIDLDGVLANFDKAVQEHAKMRYENNQAKVWPIVQTIPHFFANLEPMPDHMELVDSLFVADFQILTALPQLTGYLSTAQRDKVEWVKKYVDEWCQVNCVSNWSIKKNFCFGPDDILIDDSRRNVDDWIKAGVRQFITSQLNKLWNNWIKSCKL